MLEKAKEKREAARKELETVKRRLEVQVGVQVMEGGDLSCGELQEELEDLCSQLTEKDK